MQVKSDANFGEGTNQLIIHVVTSPKSKSPVYGIKVSQGPPALARPHLLHIVR